MTTVDSGRIAETAACSYLEMRGYRIRTRNYRQKYCEIDIIALKDGSIFFVEVKFRSSLRYGSGFDYITPQKMDRMVRGAETWIVQNRWNGPYCLAAISVEGDKYEVTGFIETLL